MNNTWQGRFACNIRGAVYHITCRGNDRRNIFRDDLDRKEMVEILVHSLMAYKVKLFSYSLMDNHFHLFVETPLGNLSENNEAVQYSIYGILEPQTQAHRVGVGYTSVSQERRRLADEDVKKDRKLQELVVRIEGLCQ